MDDIVILWDFDGTLVDTAPLWRAAEYAFLESHGLIWNDEASRRLVGGNLDLASRVIAEVTGVSFAVEELLEGMQRHVTRAIKSRVPWMPGAERLLREQQVAGVRSALVTSSYSELVAIALDVLPFSPFHVVISREDVTRPKPDPEPYRLGLDRLGAAGTRALAIEDSVSGAISALAAGCHVTMVGPYNANFLPPDRRLRHLEGLASVSLSSLLSAVPGIGRRVARG